MSSFAASSAVFAAGNVMRRRNNDEALRRKSHRRRSVATRAAALQDEEATKPQPEPKNWEYKYLYDGACPVCRSLKAGLEGEDAFVERGHFISFVGETLVASEKESRFHFGSSIL